MFQSDSDSGGDVCGSCCCFDTSSQSCPSHASVSSTFSHRLTVLFWRTKVTELVLYLPLLRRSGDTVHSFFSLFSVC